MTDYHVGFQGRAGINTANSPVVNLWTATRKVRVTEIGIFIQTAPTTAPVFAVARSTTRGTQTATLTPTARDPADIAATSVLDTTWSANPAFSTTVLFRAGGVPLAIGNGIVWAFGPNGIEVAIGAGLCLFNINATGATLGSFSGYFELSE